jgi:type IV pilus assembly protein PilA
MQKLLRKGRKGFTLIELMIVVAIIGILAAIAIPNFLRFQLKAKSSEGKVNIAAVRTVETSYHAEIGRYVSADLQPTTIPGTAKMTFDGTVGGFSTLGWAPEGQVYFQYGINTESTNVGYTVSALADIDGDAANQGWGYAKPDAMSAQVAGDGVCATPPTVINTVAACDPTFGQSVF